MRRIATLAVIAALLTTPAAAAGEIDTGLKLVAMATFVEKKCVGMTPDLTMVNAALDRIGVRLDSLMTKPRLAQAAIIDTALSRNTKATCQEAWDLFGPDGSMVPGLVIKE